MEGHLLSWQVQMVCDPTLDLSLPIKVEIDGIESPDHIPPPVPELVFTFDEELNAFEPESSLRPPPVPSVFCADMDCEG